MYILYVKVEVALFEIVRYILECIGFTLQLNYWKRPSQELLNASLSHSEMHSVAFETVPSNKIDVFRSDCSKLRIYSVPLVYYRVQPSPSKTNPGMVKCLELSPVDPNLILIGYEKGIIVSWDLDRGMPSKNYPTSIQDAQQVSQVTAFMCESVGLCVMSCDLYVATRKYVLAK